MTTVSEGMRRLAILLGSLVALVWLFFVLVLLLSEAPQNPHLPSIFTFAAVGAAVWFAGVWGFVRAIDWVRRGFSESQR